MTKLAIVGANGQVGAELCLLLAGVPGIELIPVCRNRSGSAFLRWHGLACRHGRVADEAEAPRLLADCDAVVNCSLAAGTPADIRRIENRIAHHLAAFSKPDAVLIHCSTQSVYGDPAEGRRVRWRNPYGRAKLATETSLRRAARRHHKHAVILRLGHVCGDLQEISLTIRAQLAAGTAVLPARDCSSNTVYTAAIVGAIRQILCGGVAPGTYDLMNSPRWTWREVYEYEARVTGVPFELMTASQKAARSPGATTLGASARFLSALASSQGLRDAAAKLFAHVPRTINARAMAWWYIRRARTEISALQKKEMVAEHLSWVENGKNFFPAEQSTRELLNAVPLNAAVPVRKSRWPADLPGASETSAQ